MSVRQLAQDGELATELTSAGSRLVVVDFTATWCGPCQHVAPVFARLAAQYPDVIFLKVDVDQCADTAMMYSVRAMPTFLFFRNSQKIDSLQGANTAALEEKLRVLASSSSREAAGDEETPGEAETDSLVPGHVHLGSYVQTAQCECLNESDEHQLSAALKSFSSCPPEDSTGAGDFLESDCDEQLIIALTFNQPIKLHSVRVLCRAKNGPRTLSLFINRPHTLDFDSAGSVEPTQRLILQPEQLDGRPVPLRYVKFQRVSGVQLFVADNQNGAETTRIDRLEFLGSPVASVNMSDFQRVAGKKGEAH